MGKTYYLLEKDCGKPSLSIVCYFPIPKLYVRLKPQFTLMKNDVFTT